MEQTGNTIDLAHPWLGPNDTPGLAAHRARIRTLNDRLRRDGEGGRVLQSTGVARLPLALRAALLAAVAGFTAFDAGNDPHDEHDFGAVTIAGEVYFWKIDSYDLDLAGLSPDPADPAVTSRVLTIMQAAEY